MSEITSRITNIQRDVIKSGARQGNYFYKVFLESGDTLYAWKDLPAEIVVGSEATFIVDERTTPTGTFKNIKEILPVINEGTMGQEPTPPITSTTPHAASTTVRPPSPRSWDKGSERDMAIARMSSLKSAIEFSVGLPEGGDNIEHILEVAKRFLLYIDTGE